MTRPSRVVAGVAGALLVCAVATALAAPVTFHHAAPGAQRVQLAGSFNGWSDSATALADPDGDGVWTVKLELAAGRHQYKFVVDGRWRADPSNPEGVDDGFGGKNSTLTVGDAALEVGQAAAAGAGPASVAPATPAAAAPAGQVAVTFRLVAAGARRVNLAGEFNGWSDSALPLQGPDAAGAFAVTIPLAPGRYQYKFVVDGQWKQDPANPQGKDDGFGGQNSLLEVPSGVAALDVGGAPSGAVPAPAGTPAPAAAPAAGSGQVRVEFRHAAPGAKRVNLAGEFNGWSDAALPMQGPDAGGDFTVTIPLAPGRYQYKFVVDGQWKQDPTNPQSQDDGLGGQNSVVDVPAGAATHRAGGNAAVGAAPAGPAPSGAGMRAVELRFTPVISGVSNVFLAGSFNDWNDSKNRMTDPDGDGTYAITLLLPPGSFQYKFVVDGQWKQDPNNPAGAPDGFGGQNSVLKVDDSFEAVAMKTGDGRVFTDDIVPTLDYASCNPVSPTSVELTARAHRDDVERLEVVYRLNGGALFEQEMAPAEGDPAFRYYRATITLLAPEDRLEYAILYTDGGTELFMGPGGFGDRVPEPLFVYTRATLPPFTTPDWARDGVCYQIFPERFFNGDKANDPDFSEPWYADANRLPASGRTNDEYFHLMDDWYDIAGLVHSPYRTDGKPDWASFYGGDIEGVRQKLPYLADLGVSVIYFNPLNHARSNHKYDPIDYLKVDPHFATEAQFKQFTSEAHAAGIRIVVDMAFNHTGNWHWAFRDGVEKGSASPYWNWYEWKRWPLPGTRDYKAADYYDCWWGFGIHPNLNFDLSRSNAEENAVEDVALASPNQAVVDYVLEVPKYWLGELGIDGFRLDVPNEVPFWFWERFRAACSAVKPDCYLVGELWGNAQKWIGPRCFDATMNYKFFRDPVMEFLGKSQIDAAAFDQRLAPGRHQYPPQAVGVMMNLIDSHDTPRFLTTTGDVRRLMLAAMFSLTYVGMPTIWYGDEIGMEGDKDPDCRRPFDWRYEGDPRRVAVRDFYRTMVRLRRATPALQHGRFTTLASQGTGYAFARTLGDQAVVALFNGGGAPATVTLAAADLAGLLPGQAAPQLRVVVGPESFPQATGASLRRGDAIRPDGGPLTITLPPLSGAILAN